MLIAFLMLGELFHSLALISSMQPIWGILTSWDVYNSQFYLQHISIIRGENYLSVLFC